MARKDGIGHQDFEKSRMRNIFYIDKTNFIKEWWESDDDVLMEPKRTGAPAVILEFKVQDTESGEKEMLIRYGWS